MSFLSDCSPPLPSGKRAGEPATVKRKRLSAPQRSVHGEVTVDPRPRFAWTADLAHPRISNLFGYSLWKVEPRRPNKHKASGTNEHSHPPWDSVSETESIAIHPEMLGKAQDPIFDGKLRVSQRMCLPHSRNQGRDTSSHRHGFGGNKKLMRCHRHKQPLQHKLAEMREHEDSFQAGTCAFR